MPRMGLLRDRSLCAAEIPRSFLTWRRGRPDSMLQRFKMNRTFARARFHSGLIAFSSAHAAEALGVKPLPPVWRTLRTNSSRMRMPVHLVPALPTHLPAATRR